jgi:pilus assembly protein CpaF
MGLSDRLSKAADGRVSVLPDANAIDAAAALKGQVHEELLAALGPRLYAGELSDQALRDEVFAAIASVMDRDERPQSGVDRARMVQEVTDDILGHGPLEPLLRDSSITEIMVNGPETIYIERGGLLYSADLAFADEGHLRRTIERIVSRVGRRIDEASPMVDARLPDGSRVNAVVPPIAVDGCSLTIRKFADDPYTAKDLVSMATLSTAACEVLDACVRGRLNILISGGTGSGKTTTLNVMSSFIPERERIVTIEDAAELQLDQPHVVRMESRPANVEGQGTVTIRDLVRNALRMRPDRIVVGEVRDAAALDMLQAMNTGHDGSLTTVHANSPRDAMSRVETMVLMAGMELPVRVIREQVAHAVDVIVHQERLRDGSRHVTHITEIVGMEGETVLTQDLFTFESSPSLMNGKLGRLAPTGIMPQFLERLRDRGVELRSGLFQP